MQYHDLVWHIAWQMRPKLCGILEVGDLASAAFLELMKLAERFDTNGPPFIRAAYPRIRGAMLDAIRSEISRNPELGGKEWVSQRPDSVSMDDAVLYRIDAESCVRRAHKLNALDADLLRYFYLHDMEAKDIAPIVGLAPSTVHVRLHRLKRRLQ